NTQTKADMFRKEHSLRWGLLAVQPSLSRWPTGLAYLLDSPAMLPRAAYLMAYSQCDHASPCSSCFFLLRASTRRRSEHWSQMVISDGSPHKLQTWRACSGRGSDCSGGATFMCLPPVYRG